MATTPPDLQTMITWALQQEGKSSYQCRGRGMVSTASGTCQRFVSSCYYEGGQRPYAGASMAKEAERLWKIAGTENDMQPPIGASVYMHGSSKGYGHVGLSLGGGKYIDAGASTIKIRNVTKDCPQNSTYYYHGWGWNGGTQPIGSDVDMSNLQLGSSTYGQSLSVPGGQVYTTKSTRADAILREVGSMSKDAEPSIKSDKYKLSVVNYTSLLGFTFAGSTNLSGGVSANGTVDTSGITNQNCRAIFDALLGHGLTASQCVGILVNIKRESGFRPDAVSGDGYGSIGICQWTFGRKTALLNRLGSDWKNNISGQVEYLIYELQNSHKKVGDKIFAITEVSEAAAIEVGNLFLCEFEIPAKKYRDMRLASMPQDVHEIWSQIQIQPTSSISSTTRNKTKGKVTTSSGKILTQGTSYSIPSSLNQMDVSAGIYTWYKRNWASRSNQGKVYQQWIKYGERYSDKVATIDGYYLIAMSQSFGIVGDIVTVELDNGNYFNAILGDAKGKESNSTQYGHVQGGKTNVVEWEMYYPEGKNGAKNNNQLLQSALQSSGIKGKVANVINYGSWL